MKKKLSIVCLVLSFLCQGVPGLAQENSSRIEQPKLAVKWSPLHLVYFYPSLQVALEHRVTQHVSLQYDVGWIFPIATLQQEEGQKDFINKSGFRGFAELRYYVPSPPKIPFYFAGEYYFARVTFDREGVIGSNCATGRCDYYQYTSYQVVHHNQGAGLKFGLLLFPGWHRNRSFFFDINMGVAYRAIRYADVGKPEIHLGQSLYQNPRNDIFTPSENDHDEFRLIVGMRLGYRIF